jgi:hypothetical protein
VRLTDASFGNLWIITATTSLVIGCGNVIGIYFTMNTLFLIFFGFSFLTMIVSFPLYLINRNEITSNVRYISEIIMAISFVITSVILTCCSLSR